jgi:phage shock protein E
MKYIEELIKRRKATIVDVRTPAEYAGGHVATSINIPLQEISNCLDEFKKMGNIIVCCASGIRSKQASILLGQNGIECEDGGTWVNLQEIDKDLN